MAKIKLHHSGPLGLPGGITLRPGVETNVDNWNVIKNHSVVKLWINAKVLEVVSDVDGAKKSATPAAAKSSTDGGSAPEGGASTSGDDTETPEARQARLDAVAAAAAEAAKNGGSGDEAGDVEALKARAKELDIKFTWNTKPETLREKIAEAEAAK